jgi:hypothetical protein
MQIRSIMERLLAAKEPSRELDEAIAEVLGWKRLTDGADTLSTQHLGTSVVWLGPSGDDTDHIPCYTSSLATAMELAFHIAPSSRGGFSWENGRASARIDDGAYFQAASPEIALCLAALDRKLEAERRPS